MARAHDSMRRLAFWKRAARGRVSRIRLGWILPGVLVPLLDVRLAQGQPAVAPETDAYADTLPPAVRRVVVQRLVVDRFEGHVRAAIPRAGVIDALENEESVDLVSVRELEAQQQLNDGSPEGYVEVARKLHVVAILRGFVEREDASYRAIITMIDGADGRRRARFEYSATTLMKLRSVLRTSLLDDLIPVLEQNVPPESDERELAPAAAAGTSSQPEPEPEPEPRKPAPPPASVEKQRSAPPQDRGMKDQRPAHHREPLKPAHCRVLELEARAAALRREFWYHEEQRGALRAHAVRYGPNPGASLSFFPLTLASCNMVSGLGIFSSYERLLGVSSELAGRELSTEGSAQQAALVFRFRTDVLQVTPNVGYAARQLVVEGDLLPDADMLSLRGGVDVRVSLGVFLAELGGAGHYVLDVGELASFDWFPETTAYGYDVRAALGLRPVPWFDLLLAVHAEVYRFDFHISEPLSAYQRGVAAGATDQYTQAELLMRFAVQP